MHETAQLLVLAVVSYAAFGIMAAGFAMLVAGKDGATAAGRFFFVRPFWAILDWSRLALVAAVSVAWTGVIARVTAWMASEIKEVAKDIRWLATRERGWVWRP